MKSLRVILLLAVGLLAFEADVLAQTNPVLIYVPGYTKADGTYVYGYFKTKPNKTTGDNFSTKPNVNPYTLKPGSVQPGDKPLQAPTASYSTPTYSPAPSPIILTGSRGGQYYINSKGKKSYIKH
jgi:hypothetical protein